MFDGKHLFKLDGEARVETEGGPVTAKNIIGRSYTEGDYFNGDHVPTFVIKGQTGSYTVRKEDVVSRVAIETIEE